MGIKEDPKKPGTWTVFHSKRHPVTRESVGLRRKGFKSLAEAKRAFNKIVIDVEQKIHRAVVPTWQKVVEEYLVGMKNRNITEKTIHTYGSCLIAHTYENFGDRLVDSISTEEIRGLINEKVGHRSTSHQKNLLKFIRGGFNYAVECGYINRNPVPNMKFRVGSKLKQVLTEKEVRVFLNKAKELESEWYYHWTVALYTGMRSGELYALTWDNVCFEKRQITISCAWNNKDGFKETKSGDDRIIEIAPNLQLVLKELKLAGLDQVFVLPRIDRWDKGEQARELRLFLQGIGLPAIRFHDLRATWATIMLSRGIEPIKVMIMGGWKDLKTMQYYIRKAGVDIRGAMNSLELHNPQNQASTVLILRGVHDGNL
jgi:integrase